MPLARQFLCQAPQRLRRPAKWRHRIASLVRLDQRHQRGQHSGVDLLGTLASPTWPAYPSSGKRLFTGFQLEDAPADRRLAHVGGTGDGTDAAIPEQPGFRRTHQPSLQLIQMWQQHLESHGELAVHPSRKRHTRSTTPVGESDTLILDGSSEPCSARRRPRA